MKKKKEEEKKQLKPEDIISVYVRGNDIREIITFNTILFKLMSGIVMLSNVYSRFITTIFPILKVIKENDAKADIARKRFLSLTKGYLRSNKVLYSEKDSLITSYYSVDVNNDITGDSKFIFSLDYLNITYRKLIEDTRAMASESDIKLWDKNFERLEDDIRAIYNEIISFENDIDEIFISDKVDIFNISDLEETKKKVSIKSLSDISIQSIETLNYLDDLFLIMNEIIYAVSFCIDIADPVHVKNSIDGLYNAYYDNTNPNNDISMIFEDMDFEDEIPNIEFDKTKLN